MRFSIRIVAFVAVAGFGIACTPSENIPTGGAPLPGDLAANGGVDLGTPDPASPPPDLASPSSAPPLSPAAQALIAERPYSLKVPVGYAGAAAPLLIMLHGYNSNAAAHEAYFQFSPLADEKTFLYAYPDGAIDSLGKRGWNATDACCIFGPGPKADDVAYLTAVLDDIQSKYNVDPKRVFLVGHSNGGFMANRIACELSPRIAAFVSMAGGTWKNAASCTASSPPVSMLQLHADNDGTIKYEGGSFAQFVLPPYPSAHETVAAWAAKNHCSPTLMSTSSTVDVVNNAAGAETGVERYDGCDSNASVELWTMRGVAAGEAHQPMIVDGLSAILWDFLSAHPKP